MPLRSPRFASNPRLQRAASNNPPLRSGETGEAVRILQQALIDLGFALPVSTKRYGSPDGIFGSETAGAVRQFQSRHRLASDGAAGHDTLAKLDALLPTAKPLPSLPVAPVLTHKVRLHARTINMPAVSEYDALDSANKVYNPHGIEIVFATAQSLSLNFLDKIVLDVVDGTCEWGKSNDDQKRLFNLGGSQGVGDTDILVYFVNRIQKPGGGTSNGCAGHDPSKAAVMVASTGSRWTMAHEVGHVMLGRAFRPVHDTDAGNLMLSDTKLINLDPPGLKPDQLTAMRASKYCVAR